MSARTNGNERLDLSILTRDEVAQLAIALAFSLDPTDAAFAAECREELKRRKPSVATNSNLDSSI